MKPLLAFFILLHLTSFTCFAQSNFIQGRVVYGAGDSAVLNASVFITNTSRGTFSNQQGAFLLEDVPVGTYDLVVSCIGFETQVYTYRAGQLPLKLKIQMAPKVQELATVVVEPLEKNGWAKWGKFFMENFIGTGSFSGNCNIENKETLRFRYSKKKNLLTVTAEEPLRISNAALGYNIQYQLEGFGFDFKNNYLNFLGYSLFKEMSEKGPKNRQLKNREQSFNGSMMHFMKSLYQNQLLQEGFEVKRLVKTPNREKERVRQILKAKILSTVKEENGKKVIIMSSEEPLSNKGKIKDSAEYYNRITQQPDEIEHYGNSLLTADSLVTLLDTSTKQLYFTDYLYVVFKKEKEDPAYLSYTREFNRQPFYQRSVIFLINKSAVVLDERGNYYMPLDIISYGYWGWSEKISSMLPLDYKSK
jgi:hypothetical protein